MYITGLSILGVVVAGVAYYGVSPLFRVVHVEDVVPAQVADMEKENITHDDAATSTEGTEAEAIAKEPKVSSPMTDKKSTGVVGTAGHPASGSVSVIQAQDGTYVRYENYKTINGPDLYVYVSKDLDAKEFVSLGEIRGTEGNINYKVPEGVSLKEYKYVLTWCKQFGVLFNSADVGSL